MYERNLEILAREDLGNITIQDEDTIEVLEFMGGGWDIEKEASNRALFEEWHTKKEYSIYPTG